MIFIVPGLLLTLVWAAITGSVTPHNLVLGMLLSGLTLLLLRAQIPATLHRVRWGKLALLTGLFIKELWLSAFKVAILVLRPNMQLRPGIFAYPLTVTRDFEITLLANLITLTPGTLSVEVSEDRGTLYVHALDCRDPSAEKRAIQTGFERRIREAFPL